MSNKEPATFPPREGYQDRITVRMARDKSYYIVYHGNVPPLDGQEYVSVREYDRLIESRARFSERATEAESAVEAARREALDAAASIVEKKDREISALRQELETARKKALCWHGYPGTCVACRTKSADGQ